MRFNYLSDARSPWLDVATYPREVQAPLVSIATAVMVLLAATGIETYRVQRTTATQDMAQVRVVAARAALARTALERTDVDELRALDDRIRAIRLSGSNAALRLADIANHVPSDAWLSSIDPSGSGIEISGHADGLRALGETIADLMASKTADGLSLIRAAEDDVARPTASGTLTFEMHAGGTSQ